jgi:hypothetical protein
MDMTDKPVDERIESETAALQLEQRGEVAITVGKALLAMDLILVCFVGIGLRTGSFLFSWWVGVEGLLGSVLMIIGIRQKSEAQRKLATLEPTKIA